MMRCVSPTSSKKTLEHDGVERRELAERAEARSQVLGKLRGGDFA
jgi:hypothetical protein